MLSSRRSLPPLSWASIKPFSAAGQSSFSAAAMAVTMLAAAARISDINASLDMTSVLRVPKATQSGHLMFLTLVASADWRRARHCIFELCISGQLLWQLRHSLLIVHAEPGLPPNLCRLLERVSRPLLHLVSDGHLSRGDFLSHVENAWLSCASNSRCFYPTRWDEFGGSGAVAREDQFKPVRLSPKAIDQASKLVPQKYWIESGLHTWLKGRAERVFAKLSGEQTRGKFGTVTYVFEFDVDGPVLKSISL
jgi:hypothetical protein